jgi:hypothetical protein
MNQHLSWMTFAGARKADYPQSFSYHNPWWKHYKPLGEYFARLSAALSTGEQVNRIVVLEPTTSGWLYASAGTPDPRMKALGEEFQAFITRLEYAQVEYDLASERIVRDHGKAAGSRFVIGQRAYDTVIIPPGTENLQSNTKRLLDEFMKQGGRLMAFTSPAYVDGAPSPAGFKTVSSLEEVRASLVPSDIDVTRGTMFHQRRKLKDGELLFFTNHSLDRAAAAELKLKARSLARFDLLTGRIEQFSGNRVELPPAGSLLLYAGSARVAEPAPPALGDPQPVALSIPAVRRVEPNVLTLD